jgi:hypothetical protein
MIALICATFSCREIARLESALSRGGIGGCRLIFLPRLIGSLSVLTILYSDITRLVTSLDIFRPLALEGDRFLFRISWLDWWHRFVPQV